MIPMKILMVAAEYAGLVKTGGLADAVAGLGGALADAGHDVRVLVPAYARVTSPPARDRGRVGEGRLLEHDSPAGGPRLYRLDVPGLDAGSVYTGDDRDAVRFAHLAVAAHALGGVIGWRPDVLHCHDWHAALAPSLRSPVPTMLTVHNLGYQGVFPRSAVEGVGDFDAAFEADGRVNFLKAGLRAADLVTTVSPTYAREIRTPEYGMGLDGLLGDRGDDLVGILNGVDYRTWEPASDPLIHARYDAADPSGKRRAKASLRAERLPGSDAESPLVGMVSRLVFQKGVDLLIDALPGLLGRTRAGFVVLGSGDAALERTLEGMAAAHPDRIAFASGYDEPLAHRIYAGADLFLVPSRYEPCGLTQMYALRYGTIPVVRRTGGLADTVRHFDPGSGQGNGSVFEDADPGGLTWALERAIEWYGDPAAWPRLVRNAMTADFSWDRRVDAYEAAYRRVVSR